MDRPLGCVAILAAMRAELKPVLKLLGTDGKGVTSGSEWRGQYKGIDVIMVLTGMGLEAAQAATERLFSGHGDQLQHVFVVGIAGANDLRLDIGDVVIPEIVIDERDGISRHTVIAGDRSTPSVIYSTDQLNYDADFVARLRRLNVTLVDMESGAIAAVCERNGCPITVIRAVSDKIDEHAASFDVFHLANADGSPRYGAVLVYLLRQPWKLPYLVAMAAGAKKAISAASAELLRSMERLLSHQ
ncbi:MAG: 5'-methylthioadenosine/S-adenosylhomocysteine nucleosidase [Halioglobus sp.]